MLNKNAFWSFDMSGQESIPDRLLITKTFIELDINDINTLFVIYDKEIIKKVWKEDLIPQEGLLCLFRTSHFLLNRNNLVTCVIKAQDKIVGTFTVIPPEGVKISSLSYLQTGLFRLIRKFGFCTLVRMMGMDKFKKRILIVL